MKNISEPVRVYRLLTEREDSGKLIGVEKKASKRGWLWVAAAAVVVAVVGLGLWQYYLRRPATEPASIENMVYSLPDKPSIAVLPFDNLSGDPKQEYFSDGITEEIITALSKTPKMFVIARHSTSTYKGKPVKVKQVAEELGVRYVLEGSVRKAEDRVRVTAQLIDALTGRHLWAERYDRDLKDIFALQDEITMKIINALQVELTEGEHARLWGKGTDNLEAYLKSMQARELYLTTTVESNTLARRFAEEAIALDPEYAPPYHYLSVTHFHDVLLRTTESPDQSKKIAVELLQKAIALDDSYALAHGFLGILYTYWMRDYEKAIIEAQKGVALDPNGAHGYLYLSLILRYAGKFEEAIQANEKAIRLNPFPPVTYFRFACMSYIGAGRYEEAIIVGKKAITVGPNDHWSHMLLAAAYSLTGRQGEANIEAKEVLRLNPKFSVAFWAKTLPYKNQADTDHLIGALLKAGLPEYPPLQLPDKPSIAVLAFDNLSGDSKQEYLSDGIAEDIITALSKVGELFVIARNSSFTYKGKPVKVQQVSRELGVRYILEGSLQKTGDRVRIIAQLIDAKNGQHIWAEKYDRDLKDIFEIQDEITLKIVNALRVKLTEGEQARLHEKGFNNLETYLKQVQANSLWNKGTKEALMRYGQLVQEIIEAEPESPVGYRLLGWYHYNLAMRGDSPRENLKKAFMLTQKVLAMDESDAYSLALSGYIYKRMRKYEKAIESGKRSIELQPNNAFFQVLFGSTLNDAGLIDEGIKNIKLAIRLNPFPAYYYYYNLGRCYVQKGQYEKALAEFEKALQRAPKAAEIHAALAVTYILLGREEEARASAAKSMELAPYISVGLNSKTSSVKNPAYNERIADAMRKAGFPE